MTKQLRISNKYDKMTPQEVGEVLKDFNGLSNEAMEALGKVVDVFIKKYAPPKQGITKTL